MGGGSQASASVNTIEFIVILVRKLLLPLPLLFLDMLLDEDPKSVGGANLLKAGGFIDQRGDADLGKSLE